MFVWRSDSSAVAAVVCLRCFSKAQYFHAFHVNTGHPTLSGGLNILINNTIISSMLTIKLFFYGNESIDVKDTNFFSF